MIVELLVQVVTGLVELMIGIFDAITPDPPSFTADIPGYVATIDGWMSGTEAWIPWNVVGPMLLVVGLALIAGWTIRLVRIVMSFASAGGGSAG